MDMVTALFGELSVLLVVFGALFAYGIVRGQRALISLTFGLYLALLLAVEFPYYGAILGASNSVSESAVRMVVFAIFTAFGSIFFERFLSHIFDESTIEGIGKKVVLAALAAALVMAYSYHALPLADLIDPGERIGALFAPQQYFFWWLLAPLVGIFLIF